MTFHNKMTIKTFCLLLAVTISLFTLPVQAQDNPEQMVLPSGESVSVDAQLSNGEETHPPLRLTPDRSEIINLDVPAARVIVGNETHLNLLMDSQTRLIAVPRIPGATFFTALDKNGKVIMQRHVIVAAPKQKYLRIRETCMSDDCVPTRMYYCPGMCHEILIPAETTSDGSASLSLSGNDPSNTSANRPASVGGGSTGGNNNNTTDSTDEGE